MVFLGDTDVYGPIEFVIERFRTSIDVSIRGEPVVNGSIIVVVKLVDVRGKPMSNEEVFILLDGVEVGKVTTDNNGVAKVSISLRNVEPGKHVLTVIFKGSDTHRPAKKSIEFEVKKPVKTTTTPTTTPTTTTSTRTATVTTTKTTKTMTTTRTRPITTTTVSTTTTTTPTPTSTTPTSSTPRATKTQRTATTVTKVECRD